MKKRFLKFLPAFLISVLIFAGCQKNGDEGLVKTPSSFENGVPSVIMTQTGVFAANYFFEPPADLSADSTKALQDLLSLAAENGGTVYIKSGIYRISSPLKIPDNVKVIGDFSSPESKTPSLNQTFLTVLDTEENRSSAFITLGNGSTVSGIKIYYEKQNFAGVADYPYTICADNAKNATAENITILNAYNGISLKNSCNASLRNIFITAYSYGISANAVTGSLTMSDVNVSPVYFLNEVTLSKDDNLDSKTFRENLIETATGIYINGAETVSLYNCSADTAKVGLHINIPTSSEGSVSAAKLRTVNCQTALYIDEAGKNGVAFESCSFGASGLTDSECVYLSEKYTSEAVFSNCTFTGFPDVAINSDGRGLSTVINGSFVGWHRRAVESSDEAQIYLSSYFGISNSLGNLENYGVGLFVDCTVQNGSTIEGGNYIENDEEVEYTLNVPDLSSLKFSTPYSPSNGKYIKAKDFGVGEASDDIGPSLQRAIDAAAENGAGIVFIEPGRYRIKTPVTVKKGIYLIGSGSNTETAFSTELIYTTQAIGASPLFIAKDSSGISGLKISCASFSDENVFLSDVASVPDTYIIKAEDVSSVSLTDISFKNVPCSVYLKNVTGGFVSKLSGSSVFRDIYAENCSDLIISDVVFSGEGLLSENIRAYKRNYGRGIEIYGGKNIKTLHCREEDMNSAFYLSSQAAEESGKPSLISVGTVSKNVTATVSVYNTDNAVFITPVSSPSEGYHLLSGASAKGKISVCGMITKGSVISSVYHRGGTAEIYGGIFKKAGPTVLDCGAGTLRIFGSIFPDIPSGYHILSTGGNTLAVGNAVRSDTMFAALNATYMKKHIEAGRVTEKFSIKGYEATGESSDESSSTDSED